MNHLCNEWHSNEQLTMIRKVTVNQSVFYHILKIFQVGVVNFVGIGEVRKRKFNWKFVTM